MVGYFKSVTIYTFSLFYLVVGIKHFTDINFFRAWVPEEYTEISKKASELVGLYAAPSEYKE